MSAACSMREKRSEGDGILVRKSGEQIPSGTMTEIVKIDWLGKF